MDPISIIVTALATGAAAGLKSTAEKAIKDAYASIKGLIKRKYGDVDLAALETKPGSKNKRASVAEDLAEAGASADQELLDQAKAMIDAIAKHDKATASAIGVDLEEVRAAYLKIQKVRAEGTGVKVRNGEFDGGIDIGEILTGNVGNSSDP